jgi:hypothetical protein
MVHSTKYKRAWYCVPWYSVPHDRAYSVVRLALLELRLAVVRPQRWCKAETMSTQILQEGRHRLERTDTAKGHIPSTQRSNPSRSASSATHMSLVRRSANSNKRQMGLRRLQSPVSVNRSANFPGTPSPKSKPPPVSAGAGNSISRPPHRFS